MAAKIEMNEREIRKRLDFLGFTESDAELLRSLKPWAEQTIPGFVKEFYDYQFRDSEFSNIIRDNGSNQGALEGAQAGYARMLFDGYPDMAYANRRSAIGELHARINITPQWYITSYAFYHDMFYPLVRAEAGKDGEQAVSAVNKLLNFDQALIMDTYINGLMDQMKVLVTQVASTAVNLAEASGQLSTTAGQAGQAVQGIATTSQEVARSAEEQSAKSVEVSNGMQQLSRAIEQVAQGGQQQASAVEQASIIVNQVSNATQEVARNAQAAAEGSRQASEAATAGRDMVNNTLTGMEKIKVAVDTASQRISGLGEQSAEIGKIVTVIDDIAAQTNLLALNAAIEAARAGEQGRGFAVVADEVRKLAERVTDATKEIANLVDAVQKGVNESIKATEDGSKQVEEGSALAEEAGKALNQIMESVEAVSAQIEQISAAAEEVSASSDEMVKTIDGVSTVVEENSAATEQMAANSTQVNEAVDAISKSIEESSASIQEMSASSEEMTAQVEEVVTAAQQLDQLAQDLRTAVDSFQMDEA
ncbi:MAG: hypothetical protein HQ475_11105 [SAR202 cluster bacterium]|nr:hypothetical protein [SAR202 cluster bacterium]